MKTVTENKTETQVPFPGFYQSELSLMIDSEEENIIEWYNEENGTKLDYDDFEFTIDYDSICKDYLKQYKWFIGQDDDNKLDINLEFQAMESPKFYNYSTDRLFATISTNDIIKLYAWNMAYGKASLQSAIDDMFKSCSGFSSFYDDFCHEWETKPLLEWDHNELSVLLPNVDSDFYIEWDDMHECISNAIDFKIIK
jgi:hypothetical protein